MTLGPRFTGALAFAVELHGEQARKGSGVPYVSHLLSAAALVIENGGSEDEAIAAALHDAAEDQGGAPVLERIKARYGEHVAYIVRACTDSLEAPKPPWRERKERYVRSLKYKDEPAVFVSLADKVANVRSILADYREVGELLWNRFAGKRETIWYYASLRDSFAELASPRMARLVRELGEAVSALEALAAEAREDVAR